MTIIARPLLTLVDKIAFIANCARATIIYDLINYIIMNNLYQLGLIVELPTPC